MSAQIIDMAAWKKAHSTIAAINARLIRLQLQIEACERRGDDVTARRYLKRMNDLLQQRRQARERQYVS